MPSETSLLLDCLQMKKFDIKNIEAAFSRKGYKLLENRVNLVGIRAETRKAGKFDDLFVSMSRSKTGWSFWTAEFTTDPGLHFLKNNLLNPEGCAILVPGQYRDVYMIDKHRGAYDALCQRNGEVKIYRDANRNDILDYNPDKIREGHFGINIHKDSTGGSSNIVFRASAGCQVFRYVKDFDRMMAEVKKELTEKKGRTFTYTLLTEADI